MPYNSRRGRIETGETRRHTMEEWQPPKGIQLQGAIQPEQQQPLNTFSGQVQSAQQFAPMAAQAPVQAGQPMMLPLDGKPPAALPILAGLGMMFSMLAPFLGIFDLVGVGVDAACCVLCNGNALSLTVLGLYSFQYGRWEQRSGKSGSSVLSYIAGVGALVFAALLVWLFFTASSNLW
jgi:hypothetical protein